MTEDRLEQENLGWLTEVGYTIHSGPDAKAIVQPFCRPAVSDDNPYSESLFRTLKYTPAYPKKPFASIEQARHS